MTVWRDTLLNWAKALEHPAWGHIHSRRVYELALLLASEEGLTVDEDVLFAAAYLHDAGAHEPYRRQGVDHAARSVQVADEILPASGFPPHKTPLVIDVIRGHMYDAEPEPSNEAVVFHDADTLDFLGAIGIARLVAITGRDSWAPDLPGAIALVRQFSRDLPARLHTAVARVMGEVRRHEMKAFLAALSEETDGLRLL